MATCLKVFPFFTPFLSTRLTLPPWMFVVPPPPYPLLYTFCRVRMPFSVIRLFFFFSPPCVRFQPLSFPFLYTTEPFPPELFPPPRIIALLLVLKEIPLFVFLPSGEELFVFRSYPFFFFFRVVPPSPPATHSAAAVSVIELCDGARFLNDWCRFISLCGSPPSLL